MQLLSTTFVKPDMDIRNALLQACVAVVYVFCALISQYFAIAPGNISPVWLPSGVMFALALRFGAAIWPGIFGGAFFGNIWAYYSTESFFAALASVLCASINGLGDVLAIVFMINLIRIYTDTNTLFSHIRGFFLFLVFGGIVGPLISALFGVTSLMSFGFIPSENYLFALTNWWVGDAVGVLLLTPFICSLIFSKVPSDLKSVCYLIVTSVFFGFITAAFFDLFELSSPGYKVIALLSPVAIFMTILGGQKSVYTNQLVIVFIAVTATHQGLGPFVAYQSISPLVSLQIFIAAFSVTVFSIALMVEQKRLIMVELQNQKLELESLYRHDKLTGLWNRYRIEEHLEIDVKRFERKKQDFAVFMIDIDNFKSVNDRYGHLEGDRILVEVGQILSRNTRAGDLTGRWGGEEFIIIADDLNFEKSLTLARKLVKITEAHDFSISQNVTISIGFTLCREGDTAEQVVDRADQAMYDAKRNGKNQVCSK